MATAMAPWVREVSRFWTARADERCPAPRSDEYADWTLAQLKREIAARQLRVGNKQRSKPAFVRLLLADDEVEAADGDGDGDAAETESERGAGARARAAASDSQEVVDVCDDEEDDDATVVAVARPPKRQKRAPPPQKQAANDATVKPADYYRHKLSLQAAGVDIETRRLDLEIKKEQRSAELHAVQLALAEEQLKQARLATQKLTSEWLVDQMLQKKRLREAGISPDEASGLGIF